MTTQERIEKVMVQMGCSVARAGQYALALIKEGAVFKDEESEVVKELVDCLEDVINQHCYIPEKNILDSMALSANAWGMRVLAHHGRIKIEKEVGRRIMATHIQDLLTERR